MKFSINQQEFLSVLNVVSKGTSSRAALPILAGVFIKAYNNVLTIESTNLDLSIRCTANALVEEEGEVVVPAKLLGDIVKSLPDEAIHFETTDDSATILCDATSFSVKTLPSVDFPGFPEVSAEQELSIPYNVFSSMVKRVARVVSKDETRAILTGVLINAEGEQVRMVATDSFRLAVTNATIESSVEPFEAVIAGTFLTEVASLPIAEENIKLALAENQIIITYGTTTFINRRIEGHYPNYKQLIPESFETRVTYNTKQLHDAVHRTSLLSNKTAPVKFDINSASDTTQLSTTNQDIGAAHETVASPTEGIDAEIAFNYAYVLEGLASIETESVYLEVQGSMKPGILKAAEPEDYLYLIMPVRIS